MVREWCALYILTSKCASRHNGVHFFISHLASWLRTRRFSEPTFRPSGAPNHWKNTRVSRLSYLFAHLHLLSSYSFSSDLLSSNLPLLSASALLCFSSVHIVGSLTKLPSMIIVWLNPGSWWQGQVHLEHRSSQWEHCEKDCAHVLEESQNDDANSLQSVKTIPNCRRDRRNSVRDHDIWKFPRSVSLQ